MTRSDGVETELEFEKEPGLFEISFCKVGRKVATAEKLAEPWELGHGGQFFSAWRLLEGRKARFELLKEGWMLLPEGSVEGEEMSDDWHHVVNSLPELMVETGVHPRTQWFSSTRFWRSGDRVVLTDQAVELLDPWGVSGRVVLVFEGEEAIDGHPCGVFAVEGRLVVKGRPGMDRASVDSEVTVESGKIWASLLYPVILREEYATEMFFRSGREGEEAHAASVEGRVEVIRAQTWRPEGK
ncbi:MAG: hypothetical protein ACQKBU_02910 [Verrucomicrobiales bacterium]